MPQMAPMNWMMLYLMFMLTFLTINFFNYFYLNMPSWICPHSMTPFSFRYIF